MRLQNKTKRIKTDYKADWKMLAQQKTQQYLLAFCLEQASQGNIDY